MASVLLLIQTQSALAALAGGYSVGDVVESLINHGRYMSVGDSGVVIGPCDSSDWDRADRILVKYPGGNVNVVAATEVRKFGWWQRIRESRAAAVNDRKRAKLAKAFPLPDIEGMTRSEVVDFKWALRSEIKLVDSRLKELRTGRKLGDKQGDNISQLPTACCSAQKHFVAVSPLAIVILSVSKPVPSFTIT